MLPGHYGWAIRYCVRYTIIHRNSVPNALASTRQLATSMAEVGVLSKEFVYELVSIMWMCSFKSIMETY